MKAVSNKLTGLALVAICVSVAPSAWAQFYSAVGLGTLSGGTTSYPTAINSNGQVVGYANTASGATHAFLWSAGTGMNDLGTLSGDSSSYALGINNSGQVVGYASSGSSNYAFLYNGVTMSLLGTLSGDPYSVARSINTSGQVAGYSSSSSQVPTAFLYSSGNLQNLGTLGGCCSAAYGINSGGQVVGFAYTSSGQHAALYSGGAWTDLGTLSGGIDSYANAINASGQIVGSSLVGASGDFHAFLWSAGTGMTDLGVLANFAQSIATAINSSGQVVGYNLPSLGESHAFLYISGTMTDLNNLVTNLPAGVVLEQANAINDSGQIVAAGSDGLAYILTSIPVIPLQFVPVAPCRVMDTRNATGPLGGPYIAADSTRPVPIPSGSCAIPSTASAYSLNVTVIPRAGTLSYLTVWPTGQSQPVVSTLNSYDGAVLANAAIVPAGTNGSINAYATNDTDLLIDINGYFVPETTGSLQFYPLTPCRVVDTRNATGTFGGPSLVAHSTRSFQIPSSTCNVPGSAAAYAFNVTVVPEEVLDYLSVWPTGESQPVVSTLNSYDGAVLANAAIVPAGTNGAVNFYATNATGLLVDINGYFAPPGTGGMNFYTVIPCRIVDTRNANGTFGGPIMAADETRTFPLSAGSCGIPATAAGYSLNMTVVPSVVLDYLSIWPTGEGQPVVSTLNAYEGQVVANAALVPAGTSGGVNVYVTNLTHVIIDTNGYFR